jgi:Zn-dependent protease with chaperone function
MLLPLSAWLLLRTIAPAVALPWEAALRGADAWGLLALTGALGLYAVVVFGWYARLLEHQADWLACRLIDPRDARAGAAIYLRALANLTGGVRMSRRCRTWQHASMLSRAKFLKSLVTDTTCELRFSEQIGWLNRLLVGVALGPVAFHLLFG